MANIKRANTSGVTKSGVAIADVPDAPTIGSATAVSDVSATVTYTAATTGGTGTTFTATSTPGSLTGTGSSPITVTGLTGSTAYTFTVRSSNSTGSSPFSAASSSITTLQSTNYDSIQTVTLSSAQNVVTFSSIPSTYKHLQIRAFHRGNRATYPVSDMNMRFNGDSTANYATTSLTGFGGGATTSGVQTGGTASQNQIMIGQPGTSQTGFVISIVDILDYASVSKCKAARCLNGVDINGTVAGYGGATNFNDGVWLNSSTPISSISFTASDGSDWQQYSSFALYGVN